MVPASRRCRARGSSRRRAAEAVVRATQRSSSSASRPARRARPGQSATVVHGLPLLAPPKQMLLPKAPFCDVACPDRSCSCRPGSQAARVWRSAPVHRALSNGLDRLAVAVVSGLRAIGMLPMNRRALTARAVAARAADVVVVRATEAALSAGTRDRGRRGAVDSTRPFGFFDRARRALVRAAVAHARARRGRRADARRAADGLDADRARLRGIAGQHRRRVQRERETRGAGGRDRASPAWDHPRRTCW